MKLRTIITQDAEVDDQNSLRHFLFYANEVELLGIVQTSSQFHWKGVPGAATDRTGPVGTLLDMGHGDYDKPYRWPGTDWMFRVIDDYEKDYPDLSRHAEGYPAPDYLRSITKVGNVGYEGEMEAPTEGSELIRRAILAEDDRPLYLQVWGGCNTIARALLDIQTEYGKTERWPALREKIMKKVILTACGEQDGAYRGYIAEEWPGIRFIKALQMRSYAYSWPTMPEGESKDTLRASFLKKYILTGKSALTDGYRTWLDGAAYEGEIRESQFGANKNIAAEWFGAQFGLPAGEPFDFLSEGDSPTFFLLLPCWGFRTLEDLTFGGISGRYRKVPGEVNSKGEPLDYWEVCEDRYTDREGEVHETESMWPYVADIQRDFAARTEWAAGPGPVEHAPTLSVKEGVDLYLAAGETQALHAEAASPEGLPCSVAFRVYPEASAPWAKDVVLSCEGNNASFTMPAEAKPGDKLHILVRAQTRGKHRLVRYQQVVVTVR